MSYLNLKVIATFGRFGAEIIIENAADVIVLVRVLAFDLLVIN